MSWETSTGSTSTWTASDDPSVDYARMILEKPVSVNVRRRGAADHTEQVRIEPLGGPTTALTAYGGQVDTQAIIVLGYKGYTGHADTDIKIADEFFYEGILYTVNGKWDQSPYCLQVTATAARRTG